VKLYQSVSISGPSATSKPIERKICSIRSQVRARTDLAPILYEWGTAIPGTVVFTTGQVDLIIPNGVSAGWTWSSGEWDVELTDGAGKKAWIAHDTITVEPRTTH